LGPAPLNIFSIIVLITFHNVERRVRIELHIW